MKSFKIFTGNIDKLSGWKSTGLSEKSITTPATPSNGLAPRLNRINNAKVQVKFDGSCLGRDKVSFNWKCSIVYLQLLSKPRILILINILVLDMVLDSIHSHIFWFQVLILVKMLFFLLQTIVHQRILITKEKISQFLVMDQKSY